MLQTGDENPAYIAVKAHGWLTGAKDVLEKVNDPNVADTINPSTYKYRINMSMETGDERYSFVNNVMWVGSCCRRAQESKTVEIAQNFIRCANPVQLVILDAFRIN